MLGRTCVALGKLFDRYSYENSVIFGHAKDGNIHFMLTDKFASSSELDRYAAFTEDMVDLVLAEGGSLKAEHGTGPVMAPFVRRLYGDELYQVMRQIKLLIDPAALMNPGVLLDENHQAHSEGNLQLAHELEKHYNYAGIDSCAVDGMCQTACPVNINTGNLVNVNFLVQTPFPCTHPSCLRAVNHDVGQRLPLHQNQRPCTSLHV